ncbi:hypothetical protein [Streptomyces sp. NBC_01465]|uniref:hypothetical protein n=1 Tax=Streptomyces sp. NBC_01465 TaxID=2903878 RepID=UPI002E33F2B1|nr:hypothetical protein [Streptomyces sp. NBC_01465]
MIDGEAVVSGVDVQRALKRSRALVFRRFATIVLVSLLLVVPAPLFHSGFLFPLSFLGICGLIYTFKILPRSLIWLGTCKRVLAAYPSVPRSPMAGQQRMTSSKGWKMVVLLGREGVDRSPEMAATAVLGQRREIPAEGAEAWFAGDDLFGGVILLPGTDELLLAEPREWDELAPAREAAGRARRETAKQAGLRGGRK